MTILGRSAIGREVGLPRWNLRAWGELATVTVGQGPGGALR